jgi:hypothetical protein
VLVLKQVSQFFPPGPSVDQPAEDEHGQDDQDKDDHMSGIASHGLKIAIFPAMDKQRPPLPGYGGGSRR